MTGKLPIPEVKRIPFQKFRTMAEIQNLYQDSVLCESIREDKKSGKWYKKDYCCNT